MDGLKINCLVLCYLMSYYKMSLRPTNQNRIYFFENHKVDIDIDKIKNVQQLSDVTATIARL